MKRKDYEQPAAIIQYSWRYHHIGIPTSIPRQGERYIEKYKMHISGFETSPYGIEWMRFEENSPVSELIKTLPHIAFEVDDLEIMCGNWLGTGVGDVDNSGSVDFFDFAELGLAW